MQRYEDGPANGHSYSLRHSEMTAEGFHVDDGPGLDARDPTLQILPHDRGSGLLKFFPGGLYLLLYRLHGEQRTALCVDMGERVRREAGWLDRRCGVPIPRSALRAS